MSITSYPFDNQDTTEAQYSELMREMADSGVADSSDGIGLKFTANGTGMNGTVQPGFAVVRGHAFKSTAVEPVTFAASAPAAARIDAVVLRLDPNLNSIVIAVVKGTNGVATPPALTRTTSGIYEMLLGYATIRANTVTVLATDAVDRRDLQGTTMGSWVTEQRPLAPRKRKTGFNETTGSLETWDGTKWVDLIQPPSAPMTFPWGGDVYGPWRIPNGNWTRAPGATALFPAAQAGHLYQVVSTFSVLMDVINVYASGQVRASIQAVNDVSGSPSGALGVNVNEAYILPTTAGPSGSSVRSVSSTSLVGHYYATTSGPLWFTTCFATDEVRAAVHSPFSSPNTYIVDLGRQAVPISPPTHV